jgi:hypothetical protein
MRSIHAFAAVILAFPASALLAQASPVPPRSTGPLGGWQAPSNNPGSGSGDMPGAGVALPSARAAPGALRGAYGLDLSRRIAEAQKLVDQADHGRVLTAGDTHHVRDLMREDFIAWNKRYDLLPSTYRAERDRWLVDANSLSPADWARQRLKWLEAQRDWVIAHGG